MHRVPFRELITMLDRISCGRGVLLVVALVVLMHGTPVGRCQSSGGGGPQIAPAPQPKNQDVFLKRLADFYRADWSGTASSGPAAPRRGVPSPLNSPPFPS